MRTEIKQIYFREMPFTPSNNEIIYIESSYGGISWLFDKCWREIDDALMENCNVHFRYIPTLEDTISKEQIKWYAPFLKETDIKAFKASLFNRHASSELSHYIVKDKHISYKDPVLIPLNKDYWHLPSGLMMHNVKSSYQNDFLYIPLPTEKLSKPEGIVDLCVVCTKELINYNYSFNVAENKGKNKTHDDIDHEHIIPDASMFSISRKYCSDYHFNWEVKELLEEARTIIDRLRVEGVSEIVIKRLLSQKPKLSNMVITSDCRILLTDYDIEIEMRPLVKAVYFLFLRHPDGIQFKSLPDYRQELAAIYTRLRGGDLNAKEQQSIKLVTNPLDNSINEKCARIREAFLLKINDDLTESYMVNGKRGEPKRIALSKSMVQWNSPFDDIPFTENRYIEPARIDVTALKNYVPIIIERDPQSDNSFIQ